jgi:hypothetical protein
MEAVGGFRNILSISAVVFNEIDFKLGELCCQLGQAVEPSIRRTAE